MDEWWVCPGCRSLNPVAAPRCYACRALRDGDRESPTTESAFVPMAADCRQALSVRTPSGSRRRLPVAVLAVLFALVIVALVGMMAAGTFSDPERRLVDDTDRMCAALHTARTARLEVRLSGTRCPTVLRRVADLEREAAHSADRWAGALDAVTLPAELATRAAVFRAHLRTGLLDGTLAVTCPALAADICAAIEGAAVP